MDIVMGWMPKVDNLGGKCDLLIEASILKGRLRRMISVGTHMLLHEGAIRLSELVFFF
jgi:hypothetical protein